jgi:NADH-quinone oxidoreductase subunit D
VTTTDHPGTDHPGTSRSGGSRSGGSRSGGSRSGGSDPYEAAVTDTSEGRVYTVTGGDWDEIVGGIGETETTDERIVVNMGPQHPSTHGVLRLVLELEGETVTEARLVIGYLHTGIEKSVEFRNWTQGVTFVTRMDYLSPLFNETAYSLGVEKLLGVTEQVPERATTIRVMVMELQRIASHLVWLATGGLEIGALSAMVYGFREREAVLDVLELITGLRMNHAYIRPGGLAQDLPPGAIEKIEDLLDYIPAKIKDYEKLLSGNPIWQRRLQGVGHLDAAGCIALGVSGPILRSAGLPWDLRKTDPYCGYETYDFEVPISLDADCYARYEMRLAEMGESVKIVRQAVDRLKPGPIMVEDKKIAWPAQLALGADGLGNSLDHIRTIMGTSMEALIHHFKLVTEGFRVPAGQVYVPIESPRGELGYHMVSDGGTRPFRVHVRDPSFVNLQAVPAMSEGGLVADVIAAVASIDPVMGGVDR